MHTTRASRVVIATFNSNSSPVVDLLNTRMTNPDTLLTAMDTPTLCIMGDEPSLPPLPIRVPPTQSHSHTTNPATRPSKRVKLSSSDQFLSSDPPFFSSDDDPSADNYTSAGARQKKKFRGPWYRQRPAASSDTVQPPSAAQLAPKRKLQRQNDSGIWLGSDCTEGSDADADTEFLVNAEKTVSRPSMFGAPQRFAPARLFVAGQSNLSSRNVDMSPVELARRYIEECSEGGREDVDLRLVLLSFPSKQYNYKGTLLTDFLTVPAASPTSQTQSSPPSQPSSPSPAPAKEHHTTPCAHP
jgi:hypothetical protein